MSFFGPNIPFTFRTQPLLFDWSNSSNTSLKLWMWFDSNQLERKTEEYVMDSKDFLGSVGGSLGLFLGFSLFSYLSIFMDSVFEKIKA